MTPIKEFFDHVSNDAIFATVTTLAVFTLGGFSKWLYEAIHRINTRRHLRRYFVVYLSSLLVAIQKRIDSLKLVAENAEIDTKDFVFTENLVRSEHVMQLPHTELFAALVRGFPKKRRQRILAYNELMGALDFLTRQPPIVKGQFGYFFENLRNYTSSWDQNANGVIRLHREFLAYAHAKNIKPSADPFLAQINRIVNSWSTKPNKDSFDVVNAELLNPIRALCISYQRDQRRVILLSHITEAETAHANRKRILQLTSRYFKEQVQATTARMTTIEQSISTFS